MCPTEKEMFFFLISNCIKKGHQIGDPKKRETSSPYKRNQKKQNASKNKASTQAMKWTRVIVPSTIDTLVSDQKRCTKRDFSLCIDKTSSLKTMSFLVFQIVQKMHKGPAFQTAHFSLGRTVPFHPKRKSLSVADKIQETPKREKSKSQSTLVLEQ